MTELMLANIGVVSNAVGGLGFLALALLLLVSRPGRAEGALLTLACTANAVWCLLVVAALLGTIPAPLLGLVETMRDGAWLLFVVWMLPTAAVRGPWGRMKWLTILLAGGLAAFALFRLLAPWPTDFGLGSGFVFAACASAMSLWGLILLEQLFRNAGPAKRWGLKYICLAVAALFAYDFVMYSYALLFERIPSTLWNARGAVNALVVPLIAVSAARNPAWSVDVHVSRRAAFHASALIGCGGYLLVMAIGGYYIRNFGGGWGEFIRVVFLAATILLLLVMLLSGQLRAHARVFINKHFFSYKYDYREEWLSLTRRLSGAEEAGDPYQRSIRAVAHVLDSPGGALWLLRDGSYVCVASWNMPVGNEAVEPADAELPTFLRRSQWIVDMQEYERNPGHYGGLSLPGWLRSMPRARLIIPFLHEDELLGYVLLAAPRAAYALTWEDLDLLKTIGSQVGGFLGQQESNQALAQARQFEAFNRLTAFLMHDLKNIMAQQSLIIQNAAKHKHNPEFVEDMIMTVDSSVDRMKRLLEQLQRATVQSDTTRRVDVRRLLREVFAHLRQSRPEPQLKTDGNDAFVRLDPERFSMILGHVIRNAQEATQTDGRVQVQVSVIGSNVRIEVEDDGVGMEPAFVRESLFRPFYTTKASRGMGIGAYQAREFVRAAGGDVEVTSQPGTGTVFAITLPVAAGVADDASPDAREASA